MFKIRSSRVFFVLLALVVCTGNVYAGVATLGAQSLLYISPGPAVAGQSWATITTTFLNSSLTTDYYFSVASQTAPWFTVSPQATLIAKNTTGTITIAVNPGTNGANIYGLLVGGAGTTASFTFQLSAASATGPWTADTQVSVNLKLYNSPFLSAAPAAQLVTGGSGPNALSTTTFTATNAAFNNLQFYVDPLTVPAWLQTPTCTVVTTCTLSTSTLNFALMSPPPTLTPGLYPASIGLVTQYDEFYVPIQYLVEVPQTVGSYYVQDALGNRLVEGVAAGLGTQLTTAANTAVPITVTIYGDPDPVNISAFTCSAALAAGGDTVSPVPASPCLANGSTAAVTGVAYPMGLPITLSVDPIYFNQRVGNTIQVTFTFSVNGGGAKTYELDYLLVGGTVTLTSVFPASVQKFTTGGSVTLLLTGTNFVGTQNSTLSIRGTQVWWGDSLVHLTNPPTGANGGQILAASISVSGNGTLMYVTVPGSIFTNTVGHVVYLGVANQTSTTAITNYPATGGASMTFRITANPVITSITNSGSYAIPVPGVANVAPYELVSIFGNLIPASDFGVTPAVVPAVPDAVFGLYPASVLIGTRGNKVSVAFYTDANHTQNPIAARLLFAGATQINCAVPGELVVGTTYYVSVDYQTVAGTVTTHNYSDSFTVTAVAADPGLFTMNGSGKGQAAVLVVYTDPATGVITTKLNSGTDASTKASNGDVLQIYLTGLGVPDSSDLDTADPLSPGDNGCIAISTGDSQNPGYLEYVNNLTPPPAVPWSNIDGAIIKTAWVLSPHLPPCLSQSALPVTVIFSDPSGVNASIPLTGTAIAYAGFVGGSVAGLYQVNVTIPSLVALPSVGNNANIQVALSSAASSTGLGITPLGATVVVK